MGFSSISQKLSLPKDPNFVNLSFSRNYCSGKNSDGGSGEWTEEIEYLDESGSVIYSGKGVRSVEPGEIGRAHV